MNLSHKLTFSLICFVVLLSFAAIPAMAGTIEATWVEDYDDTTYGDQPGWDVTLRGLEAADAVTVTYLDRAGTAVAAAGTQIGFDAVATGATSTTGSIEAARGVAISVQVVNTTDTVTYQRVDFPAGGPGATLASTALARLPKLRKFDTPNYYVNHANNETTVMFDFEAAEADSHDAPSAMLHISDVALGANAASLQITGVSGTNMVMVRSTLAAAAASANTILELGDTFAQDADTADSDVPENGTARVIYDDTAPTAAVPAADADASPPAPYPLRAVSLSTDFAAPEVDEDTVWDEDFYLRVLINDDDAGGGVEFVASMISFDKANKLEVVQVGIDANQSGEATDDANDGVYLIHLRLLPNRVTTAGEEVVIIITPVDMSGNPATAPARQTVKLAEMAAPPVQPNRAPDFGVNTIQDITAQATVTAINVTLPAAVDADNDALTYSISPALPAGLTFTAGTRVLSGTPTAMMAMTQYTYTATDGDSATDTIMFNITVSAAPVPVDLHETESATMSAAITIQPQSFVVVVRDMDAMNNQGITFRSDVTVVEWSMMPDLERLFYRGTQGVILGNGGGGALILKESAAQDADHNRRVGSVGISEIMWGIDNGHLGDETKDKSGQWIELHNLNAMVEDNADTMDVDESDDGVAKVYLSWKTGRDITNDSALTGNLANPVLDVVTNFFNNRPGGPAWDLKGNSGNSVAGEHFASMARILPHQRSAYANADGARYDNRDGRNAGHWSTSGSAYLNARTTITDGTDVVYQYRGTPGRANHVSVDTQPHVRKGREFKPASNNIIINEVGNSSNDAYDWIELRSVSGKVNLKNYIVTKLIRDNNNALKEVVIARFPANDNVQLEKDEVFLILKTDPADDLDHPIAATGYNVDKPSQEQVPGTPNSPVRYKVQSSLHIPNDGNVVLVVRRPDSGHNNGPGQHKGQGTSETASQQNGGADLDKIVDIAGYHSNLSQGSYPNPVSSTNLWPLYAFDPPNFTNNRFDQNTVHQRNRTTTNNDRSGVGAQDNANDHRTAFGGRGWTGVGYRRMAAQTGANGGTPGYPNGAFHDKGGTINSLVYISEIMYADDARGSLPQWIELRNPSPTLGANLHNWRLTITNHDSMNEAGDAFTGKGSAFVLLRHLEIKPNSAVLITSRKGPREDVRLPDDDIFVLYPTHRGAFGMSNATSDVLNVYGFNITLHSNAHDSGKPQDWQLVDAVGNLAERRTASRAERTDTERYDAPRWMWPDANAEDGARISVARTNMRGGTQATGFMVADGKSESGWILSTMDMRTDLVAPTYYGHREDWSTPGQTRGQPLPVELSFFRPTLENGKVTIQWTTESELDNAGFNILRSDSRDGEFTKVNEQMIQGKGTTAERSTYKWVDTTAKPGVVYYYQIEDVSFAGQHNTLATTKLKGLVSAKGKATTRWGELKNLR